MRNSCLDRIYLAGEIGTLAPGACADLAVLRQTDGVWQAIQTIRAGQVCG